MNQKEMYEKIKKYLTEFDIELIFSYYHKYNFTFEGFLDEWTIYLSIYGDIYRLELNCHTSLKKLVHWESEVRPKNLEIKDSEKTVVIDYEI